MKLILNEEETKLVLLQWAEKQFPNTFNAVEIECSYSSLRSVEFNYEKPAPKEETA